MFLIIVKRKFLIGLVVIVLKFQCLVNIASVENRDDTNFFNNCEKENFD